MRIGGKLYVQPKAGQHYNTTRYCTQCSPSHLHATQAKITRRLT